MDKNTNIKSQNIKTSIKNCCTSNSVKVFNNSSFFVSNKIIYPFKFLAKLLKPMKSKTHWQDLLVLFSNSWIVRRIKKDSNNQVWLVLLFLVYEERKKEVIDKLVEFIYQLSVENVKVAIGILKEPIHFVKGDREK